MTIQVKVLNIIAKMLRGATACPSWYRAIRPAKTTAWRASMLRARGRLQSRLIHMPVPAATETKPRSTLYQTSQVSTGKSGTVTPRRTAPPSLIESSPMTTARTDATRSLFRWVIAVSAGGGAFLNDAFFFATRTSQQGSSDGGRLGD